MLLLQEILVGPLRGASNFVRPLNSEVDPRQTFRFTPATGEIWVYLAGSCHSISRATVGLTILLNDQVPRHTAPALNNPIFAAWGRADDRGGRVTLIPMLACFKAENGVKVKESNTISVIPVSPDMITDNLDVVNLVVWDGPPAIPPTSPAAPDESDKPAGT